MMLAAGLTSVADPTEVDTYRTRNDVEESKDSCQVSCFCGVLAKVILEVGSEDIVCSQFNAKRESVGGHEDPCAVVPAGRGFTSGEALQRQTVKLKFCLQQISCLRAMTRRF